MRAAAAPQRVRVALHELRFTQNTLSPVFRYSASVEAVCVPDKRLVRIIESTTAGMTEHLKYTADNDTLVFCIYLKGVGCSTREAVAVAEELATKFRNT